MKLWIPVAAAAVLILAYVSFYAISLTENQGATSLGLANSVGLVAVLVGVVAAGLLLRRASPPQ
jgi:hypothetical protein